MNVIIAPHPDDETICCGGLIVDLLKQRKPVHVIFVTDGRFGSKNPSLRGSNILVNLRKEEARRATSVLGLEERNLTFLDFPDKGVSNNIAVKKRITELLNELKPDAVFYPESTDLHEDHSSIGVFVDEIVGNFGRYRYIVWGEKKGVPKLALDITKYYGRKLAALFQYSTQLGGLPPQIWGNIVSRREIFY
ncbi:PIG-L family deacetylase [Sulfolobales archaeon HS-7]|nr:PIG-L family deacetylase [Sulfolobales archaeon HS-7]